MPLGAFLSGGLDSSAVVAFMAEAASGRVKTFTIGFAGGREYDEREHARVVAERFGTEHTEFVVEPKALDLVDRLVWHHDGPFGDSSAIPTYLLSELTRSRVTVALNGDGGDEVFAGLPADVRRRAVGAPPALGVPGGGRGAAASLPEPARPQAPAALREALRRGGLAAARRALPALERLLHERAPRSAAAGAARVRGGRNASSRATASRSSGRSRAIGDGRASTLSRLLQLNFETYLLDDLHVKMDRMSMAHALETRSPFLDTAVVEFGASLPDRLRMRLGKGKILLRRAMRGILPESILARGKMGFGAPLGAWFRGELDGLVRERLLDPASPIYEYLRPEPVAALVAAHRARHGGPEPADLGAADARELAAAGAELGTRRLSACRATAASRPAAALCCPASACAGGLAVVAAPGAIARRRRPARAGRRRARDDGRPGLRADEGGGAGWCSTAPRACSC